MDDFENRVLNRLLTEPAGEAPSPVIIGDGTPEAAAKALEVERETGLPASLAMNDGEIWGSVQRERDARIASESKLLREAMRDPVRTALMRPDLGYFAELEVTLKNLHRSIGEPLNYVGRFIASGVNLGMTPVRLYGGGEIAMVDFVGKSEAEIFDTILPEDRRKELSGKGLTGAATISHMRQEAARIHRYLRGRTREDVLGRGASALKTVAEVSAWTDKKFPRPRAVDRFTRSDLFTASMKADNWGDQISFFFSAVAKDPSGFSAFLLNTLGESAPGVVTGVGAGYVAGRSGAGIAGRRITASLAMGATSGSMEYGGKVDEFLIANKIDLTTEAGVKKLFTNPELMKEAQRKGIIKGLVVGVIDALSGGVAGIALAKSPVGDAFAQAAAQALMGGAGEALGELAAGDKPHFVNVMMEMIAEVPFSAAEVAGVGLRGYGKSDEERSKASARAASVLTTIDGIVEKMEIKKTSPETLSKFFADAGAAPMMVPASDLQTLFDEQGLKPKDLGIDEDVFGDALATGGDVEIALGDYATKISGGDLADWFKQHSLFTAGDMSASEAQTFKDQDREAQLRRDEEMQRRIEMEDRMQEVERAIAERLSQQFRGNLPGGRQYAEDTLALMKGYLASYVDHFAKDGWTVEDMANRLLNLSLQSPEPGRALAELVDQIKASGGKAPGPMTLTDFVTRLGGIKDPQGVLERIGAGEVANEAGKALNEVAQAAVEAGYVSRDEMFNEDGGIDAAMVPMFLAVLQDEMRGQPTLVSTEEGRAAQDLADTIRRLGLPIDTMSTAEIVSAIRNAARSLNQIDLRSAGEWRNATVTGTDADGNEIEVNAGEYATDLDRKIETARQLLECVNAG